MYCICAAFIKVQTVIKYTNALFLFATLCRHSPFFRHRSPESEFRKCQTTKCGNIHVGLALHIAAFRHYRSLNFETVLLTANPFIISSDLFCFCFVSSNNKAAKTRYQTFVFITTINLPINWRERDTDTLKKTTNSVSCMNTTLRFSCVVAPLCLALTFSVIALNSWMWMHTNLKKFCLIVCLVCIILRLVGFVYASSHIHRFSFLWALSTCI